MQIEQLLQFGLYRLNPRTGQVWRGKQEVKVTPKAAAVLCQLVARAGQMMTKAELFQTVWAKTVVSDAALSSCIQELRRVLHDQAKSSRYIETGHGRGYRFIERVVSRQEEENQKSKGKGQKAKGESSPSAPSPQHPAPTLVGRDSDLAFLHERLAKALSGERQIVFVTGEPGIGKTTLVETFRQRLESGDWRLVPSPRASSLKPLAPRWWVAVGRCIEHYGAGEAYLPILEALGRLCRDSEDERLMVLLHQHAPSWLVQLPSVLSPTELEALQRRTAGVTRERMLRELAEALEVITAERPLVLVLEDLHWSDVSTLDLLSMLARRQEMARLLIVGTYRPVEVLTREHPLKGVKQELQLHGQCEELVLDFLSEAAVRKYLVVRFGTRPPHPGPLPQGEREPISAQALHTLAHVIHRRTDGNPLFMVNVVNDLIAQGVLTKTNGAWELHREVRERTLGTPVNLRQLIEQQIARISPDERKILEAASVAGAEFSAAAVAAGIEQSPETVETYCDGLVRREQFLRAQGTSEWLDGAIAARYGFVHALYQEVLYEQISASRRSRLHRQIGEREEQGYGERAGEIAAELAVHFERGRDYRRAVQYLQHAGGNASQRNAYVEAISLLSKGLELLKILPDTPERTQQELTLQIALGALLVATKGIAAPEVKNAYARARELCQLTGETSQLFPVLQGLCEFYGERGEYQTALELGEQLLTLAERQPDPALRLVAHQVLADHLFWLGEFATAREHLEHGIALYDAQLHRALAFRYGYDPGVICRLFAAIVLWVIGYPEQALKEIHTALSIARELSHVYTVVCVLHFASRLHQLRREAQAAQERAETEIALCTEQGFAMFLAGGSMYRGWALAEQGQGKEGIAQIRQGMTAYRATGAEMAVPYFLALLAEACGQAGEAEQGLAALGEALAQVEKTGERMYEAELYRIKGELLLAQEIKS